MPLSDAEVHSLAEIADHVYRADPRLARGLSRGRFGLRVVDVVTVVLTLMLAATLGFGIALHLSVVCGIAWGACMTLMILRGMWVDAGD